MHRYDNSPLLLTKQGHLLGQLRGLEAEEVASPVDRVHGGQVELGQEAGPHLLVLDNELGAEGPGQAEVPLLDQARHELRQRNICIFITNTHMNVPKNLF